MDVRGRIIIISPFINDCFSFAKSHSLGAAFAAYLHVPED